MIREISPREAFNCIARESILLLQIKHEGARIVDFPGAGVIVLKAGDANAPEKVSDIAKQVYDEVMSDYPPDNCKRCIILGDGADNRVGDSGAGSEVAPVSNAPSSVVANFLLTSTRCKEVGIVDITTLLRNYPFMGENRHFDFTFPSEITDTLLLGGQASVNKEAICGLNIGAVVSVVDYQVTLPAPAAGGSTVAPLHLQCPAIADANGADLAPVLAATIPFIERCHTEGRRVLIHCAQGKSRSASVLIAYMLHAGLTPTGKYTEALDMVRMHRPFASPNEGFTQQLLRMEREVKNR